MDRHRARVVRDQYPFFGRCQFEYSGIRKPSEPGFSGALEVYRRLAMVDAPNDCKVQIGIRKVSDTH